MEASLKALADDRKQPDKTALVLCPQDNAGHTRPLLGLTVGERLLHCLARAGVSNVAFAGDGPKPDSDRADVNRISPSESSSFQPESGFFVLPADLVFDSKLLKEPVAFEPNVPIKWLPPSEWRAVLSNPGDWLEKLGQGSAEAGIGYAIRVTDRDSRRRARKALLDSLRKPIDGFVSRHLNRPASLFITRFLVQTPLRPNYLTIAFAAIGVAAAAAAAFAQSWWALVLAGVLLQAQSILDGCDGEIARLTYRFSHLGQWLDTIGDDLTNYLFCLGLAIGQARALDLPFLYAAGAVTLIVQCAASGIMYRRLIQWGTGDLLAIPDTLTLGQVKGLWGKILGVLGVIRKRDVFVLVVAVVTAAQQPLVGFFLIAGGTYASFVGIVVNDRRISKMQRADQIS